MNGSNNYDVDDHDEESEPLQTDSSDNDDDIQESVNSDLLTNPDDAGLDDDSSDNDIKRFVLRHLKHKVQHGMSQEATMSGLRNLYECLEMIEFRIKTGRLF